MKWVVWIPPDGHPGKLWVYFLQYLQPFGMGHGKGGSSRKRRSKSALPAGVVGLSLSLAGAACTQSSAANAQLEVEPVQVLPIDLRELEVVEVTLATFHAFDREDSARPPPE